jgi:hypothetical protein
MKTQGRKTMKVARGLLLIVAMAAAVVMLLALADRLPSLTQKDFARRYDSIEEAKRSLGLDSILVPAYFPEGISWPPSLIVAQKKPYEAVVMEFAAAAPKETAMIIIQSSLPDSKAHLQRIHLSELKEETQYVLKGRNALLQVGICENKMPCSRITWQDKGLYCTVVLMSSPFELIKMAESMLR